MKEHTRRRRCRRRRVAEGKAGWVDRKADGGARGAACRAASSGRRPWRRAGALPRTNNSGRAGGRGRPDRAGDHTGRVQGGGGGVCCRHTPTAAPAAAVRAARGPPPRGTGGAAGWVPRPPAPPHAPTGAGGGCRHCSTRRLGVHLGATATVGVSTGAPSHRLPGPVVEMRGGDVSLGRGPGD